MGRCCYNRSRVKIHSCPWRSDNHVGNCSWCLVRIVSQNITDKYKRSEYMIPLENKHNSFCEGIRIFQQPFKKETFVWDWDNDYSWICECHKLRPAIGEDLGHLYSCEFYLNKTTKRSKGFWLLHSLQLPNYSSVMGFYLCNAEVNRLADDKISVKFKC